MKIINRLLVVVIVGLLLMSCKENVDINNDSEVEPMKGKDFILDTVISITIYDKKDEDLIKETFDLCRYYESILSSYIEDSDVGKINNGNGEFIEVSDDTIEIIKSAIYYSELSDGKFDITIGAVSLLWDFKDGGVKPSNDIIKENIKHVDYKNIEIDGNKVRLLHKDAKLDLGAIAKGYIGDKLKEFLVSKEVRSGIINLGGNVVLIGSKYPNDTPFGIGIRQPFLEREEVIGRVDVSDLVIVSSGIYERFFIDEDENFYHHILNTSTGYPVENELSSITIISDNSMKADAISTLSFILGIDESIEFIEGLDNTEAILIDKDNNLYFTSGINKSIPFTKIEN